MTTPNQVLTPGISEWLGVGAYQIGGADSNFGQDVTEEFVEQLVMIPQATFATMFDILEEVLLKLPLEMLEAFKPFIPDWLEDDILDVAEAVAKIIGSFDPRDPLALWIELFNQAWPALVEVFQELIVDPAVFIVEIVQTLVTALQPPAANNWLSAVGEAWEGTLAQIATLQAQVAAINNHASTPASQTGIDIAGWTNVSGTMAFSSNGTYLQTAALAAAYRTIAPATDKHFASVEIDAKQQGTTRVVICSDTAMTNYAAAEIYCGFDGDSVRIVTGASPSLVVVQKEAAFLVPKLSNKWAFEIRYNSTTNQFYALKNGAPIPELVWTDSTNIVTHGGTKRKVGVITNAYGGATGLQGPGISKFTFGDWV